MVKTRGKGQGQGITSLDGPKRGATADEARLVFQEAVRSAVKAAETKVDTCIDQVRSDAEALEVAARILDDAPRGIFQVPHKAETVAALFALAAGMRIAADSFPHSSDVPF